MDDCVERMASSNDETVVNVAVGVLKKLLRNYMEDPQKYNSVKLTNKVIAAKVVNCVGAVDFLISAGFEQNDELLVASEVDAKAALLALEKLAPKELHLACSLPHLRDVRAVSLKDDTVATGCLDNVVRTFSAKTGSLIDEFKGHSKPAMSDPGVLCVALSDSLFSGGRDGLLIKWSGKDRQNFMGHGEAIGDEPMPSNAQQVACCCVLGNVVLTGGWDRTVVRWSMSDDDSPATRYGPFGAAVNGVSFINDKTGVAASGDGILYLIDLESSSTSIVAPKKTFAETKGMPIRSIATCGDAKVVTASNDGILRFWDLQESGLLRGLKVSEEYLFAVSATEKKCATAGDDGVITIVSLPQLTCLQRLALPGCVWSLAMNENFLICGCEDAYGAYVYTVNPEIQASTFIAKNLNDISNKARLLTKLPVALLSKEQASDLKINSGGSLQMGHGYDFSFPVEIGNDKLTLQWNKGDDPYTVAITFLNANRLPSDQVDDIINFMASASGTTTVAVDPQKQAAMLAQVMALGIDEDRAQDALQKTNFSSVEAAINLLYTSQ